MNVRVVRLVARKRNSSQFPQRGNIDRTWGLHSHLHFGDEPCPFSPSHGFLHHTIEPLNNAIRLLAITDLEMHTWGFKFFISKA